MKYKTITTVTGVRTDKYVRTFRECRVIKSFPIQYIDKYEV